MKSKLRKYYLLVSCLFASYFYPGSGVNIAYAEVPVTILDSTLTRYLNFASNQPLVNTTVQAVDTIAPETYKPDPHKAVWYSALCPGLGQLYNHRYWKLPFVGAGVVGIAYAIGWNGKYYNAYTNAYRDISDNDPNTTSYLDLLPKTSGSYNTSQLATVLKNRQQTYRRSRDLSYIGAVGVYLLCLIDAYVDAQLYDFDISPDLSILPRYSSPGFDGARSVEISLAYKF